VGTLKPQSNGPLYINTVIGTLAVDGWAVTFGTARRVWGWARAPPSPLLAVPNVTAHASTTSVPTSHYLMWYYNCLWTLKGQLYAECSSCRNPLPRASTHPSHWTEHSGLQGRIDRVKMMKFKEDYRSAYSSRVSSLILSVYLVRLKQRALVGLEMYYGDNRDDTQLFQLIKAHDVAQHIRRKQVHNIL